MAFNLNKAFEVSDDGLLLTSGAHIISGASSPYGALAPTSATWYYQTNGFVWFHVGSGGVNAWILQNKISYNSEALSETSTTSSGSTYANKISLVTPSLELGDCIISWSLKWRAGNANRGIGIQIKRNTSEILTAINFSANVNDFPIIGGIKKQSGISGVQTIDLGFNVGVGSTTIYCSEALLTIERA